MGIPKTKRTTSTSTNELKRHKENDIDVDWFNSMNDSDDDDDDDDNKIVDDGLDALLDKLDEPPAAVVDDVDVDNVIDKAEQQQQQQQQKDSSVSLPTFDMFGDTDDCPIVSDMLGVKDVKNPNIVESRLADDLTDDHGYYAFRVGEILNKKYIVEGKYGSGVFSVVLKVKDAQTQSPVAIKVNKANSVMTRAANKELDILRLLAERDQHNKRHCIKLIDSFTHRNHFCIALEPLECSLREVLKKFGKNAARVVGLSATATRSYTKQLAIGLKFLSDCGIVHMDLKPDNVLVTSNLQTIKISDFGSAIRPSEAEITPNIVSRYYRPPEVILGHLYSHPLDMWALGCIVYELFTGVVLFPGEDNNGMLHVMQDLKGGLPRKMVRHAEYFAEYFNDNNKFMRTEIDSISKLPVVVPKTYIHRAHQLKHLIDVAVCVVCSYLLF